MPRLRLAFLGGAWRSTPPPAGWYQYGLTLTRHEFLGLRLRDRVSESHVVRRADGQDAWVLQDTGQRTCRSMRLTEMLLEAWHPPDRDILIEQLEERRAKAKQPGRAA